MKEKKGTELYFVAFTLLNLNLSKNELCAIYKIKAI